MSFIESLKIKLSERNIKPAELARRAGLTKQNLGRLLNNTPHPVTGALPTTTKETVIKIAKAIDWNVDEALLIAGYAPINQPQFPPEIQTELTKLNNKLSAENISETAKDRIRLEFLSLLQFLNSKTD